jgi:transcriptional regulator with XRE-family HTH domain
MTLGEQIRCAREERGLSQEDLAEALGVSRQAVSKWETGAAVPQGENRARLGQLLGLEAPKQDAPRGSRPVLGWVGWGVAAALLVLLLVLIGLWYGQRATPPDEQVSGEAEPTPTAEDTVQQPTLCTVRFYDDKQQEVLPQANWYQAEDIDSMLVQWTGEEAPSMVRVFFTPAGTQTGEQAELLATQVPDEGGNALLLSAACLHRDSLMGHLTVELAFDDGQTVTSELYGVLYETGETGSDDGAQGGADTVLAYIQSLDGDQLTFDPVEWIDFPSQRAQELGLTDPGGGFLVYNAQEDLRQYSAAGAEYTVLNWDADYVSMQVTAQEFQTILADRAGTQIPYTITIQNDQVVSVQEYYVP